MKYNFGEKKNLNRKNNATETENTKKKKKRKTETIFSYLTQHKTQRNLGGVILQAHVKVQKCIYRFKKCIC